jgi:hypothetical protein
VRLTHRCDGETDWNSVFQGLRFFGLRGDLQVLVRVKEGRRDTLVGWLCMFIICHSLARVWHVSLSVSPQCMFLFVWEGKRSLSLSLSVCITFALRFQSRTPTASA